MDWISVIVSVAVIWAIAVVTPGPNFFVTARSAIAVSRAFSIFVVLGIGFGTVLWGLAGFFGITLLFSAAPWLYTTLKVIGGCYLIFLGLKLMAKSFRTKTDQTVFPERHTGRMAAVRSGLLTILANPKTGAFATSVFAATMPPDAPLWLGLVSVGLMAALSLTWYSTVACMFSSRPVAAVYLRCRRWIDRSAGVVFMGFGMKLALQR